MEDYDRVCLQSWLACGFRVLAYNCEDEIPALAARYPEVEFIPAKRTAHAIFGRKTPFIADMAAALAQRPERALGIINSDLLFEPDGFWSELPAAIAGKAVLTGQRYDLRSLTGTMNVYFPGFDYFFFDHEAAAALAQAKQPFSMGLPWWDYWFPLSLALRGYNVRCLSRPAILHLQHDQQVNARTPAWRRLAREFARDILRDIGAGLSAPEDWRSFVDLCRTIDKAADMEFEEGAFDQQIIDLSSHSVPLIARDSVELAMGSRVPIPKEIPAGAFDNLAGRAVAGTALVRGLWDEKHGNLPRAEWQFELAVKTTPFDASVLYESGNFFYRQGKMRRAAEILTRAAELAPPSAVLLNSLGSALGQINRDVEAAVCFERAIAVDPLFGGSYYNLAISLWPKGRHEEAIRRLEGQMALLPDFPEGALWLGRIRDTLSRLGRVRG